MLKLSRASGKGGWKAILKYGLALALCYGGVNFYVDMEQFYEERDKYRDELKNCYIRLSGMEIVPIAGGGILNRSRLIGFHFGISAAGDTCVADTLEGSFWWTGSELRTHYQQRNKEPLPSWGSFNVTARLYTRTVPAGPFTSGLRHIDWPEELTVKLKNYPGLEFWLDALPPSSKNEYSIRHFVVRDWRRSDGTPRVIVCNGLASPSRAVLESGLNKDALLTFNRWQLEELDFGELNAYCSVELSDFDFAGGDAFIGTGTGSLLGAPMALKLLREYLSQSVITRK